MLLNPTSVPRDVCTFGNVPELPEHVGARTCPNLDVLDVGLAARASKTSHASKVNGNLLFSRDRSYFLS
jgi:hypothetical protein